MKKIHRLTFLVPIVLRESLSDVDPRSCRCISVVVDAEAVGSSNPYCCL